MQQVKPSVIQPTYKPEFLQQLTWIHSDSTPWTIGLPIKVDPMSVTPPYYIYFQPKFSTIEMFKGHIRISPYPELDAISVIDFLEHLDMEPIHKLTEVPKKTIAIRLTQALLALKQIMRIEEQLRNT